MYKSRIIFYNLYLLLYCTCDLYLYISSILFCFTSRIAILQYPNHSVTDVVIRFMDARMQLYLAWILLSSFYSRTYESGKIRSVYNPSFSHLAFLSLLAHSLVRRNEPPLSRSFSRAHSTPTEINLMFSRISGLLISPPLIYRRRPCISTHKRGREPSSPHVPLTFVFQATPRPKTSVPRFSLI